MSYISVTAFSIVFVIIALFFTGVFDTLGLPQGVSYALVIVSAVAFLAIWTRDQIRRKDQ
jgi:Flp pilus assembly protein TadB